MLDYQFGAPRERSPAINLIVIFLMVGLGFVILGPIVGYLIAMPFYNGQLDLLEAIESGKFTDDIKVPLYIMQGSATVIGLIATPAVYMMSRQKRLGDFFSNIRTEATPLLLTVVIVVIFMGVNSIFIEWNAKADFPAFADEFEKWAREREDALGDLTKFLTTFSSNKEFLLAMLVIAVLPAIGEEIVFRGLIQNELRRATNVHVAIWFAAFLFSAIHFQFFGFVPRLLLGALFGYLYYWSGNLTLAIVAHFVNNGVSVVALYMHQRGLLEFDVESSKSMPMNVVAISAVLTVGLLFYFHKYYKDRTSPSHNL
jgi:membrane protease YdiL (CAAX protease family)